MILTLFIVFDPVRSDVRLDQMDLMCIKERKGGEGNYATARVVFLLTVANNIRIEGSIGVPIE